MIGDISSPSASDGSRACNKAGLFVLLCPSIWSRQVGDLQ
jgi:hypothetical protein